MNNLYTDRMKARMLALYIDPGINDDPYDYEWTGPGNDTDSGADEGSAPEGSGDYGTVDENYEDD